MQKLKNCLLDRMIENKLTSNEVDFLLYISRFQDDAGTVPGIHYTEVCEAMHISCQGFYNVKASLTEKGFIQSEKNNRIDHDITILDNAFLDDADWKAGYVNTNHSIFYQETFYKLKAGAKLLAMEIMKVTRAGKGQFRIGTGKFYEKYCKLFGVSKRVMRGYLMSLKAFFSIGIVGGIYYMRPRLAVYTQPGQASEADNYNRHNAEVICRRNNIKEMDEKSVKDVSKLITQYKSDAIAAGKSIVDLLGKAVEKSLETLNAAKKRTTIRKLKPKLVHLELRKILFLT